MSLWADMTEEERIQHSLKWGTDYARNKGYADGRGMQENGQQKNAPATGMLQPTSRVQDQGWYNEAAPWTGEIDQKNLGMTGLNESDYRDYQARLAAINGAFNRGDMSEQDYKNAFVGLTDAMGINRVVEGTDKTYFLDPGVNLNLYDTNIKGNFGERPGLYRRHAQTEGEGFFGQFDEAKTVAPLLASVVAPHLGLGAIGTGLLTGGASLASGNSLAQAALQGVSSGALAGTAPSATSPLDPNVIMNLTQGTGPAVGEMASGLLSDALRAQMRNTLLESESPDIAWQDVDVSDMLGDVQVQVPDYSAPQGGSAGAPSTPGTNGMNQDGGQAGPEGPDTDPFGTGGQQSGGPGALDEPNEGSIVEGLFPDMFDNGDRMFYGWDAEGNWVDDPANAVIEPFVPSQDVGFGMAPDGSQNGAGPGTGSGSGPGEGVRNQVQQQVGNRFSSQAEFDEFMAGINYVLPVLRQMNIPLQDYLAMWK